MLPHAVLAELNFTVHAEELGSRCRSSPGRCSHLGFIACEHCVEQDYATVVDLMVRLGSCFYKCRAAGPIMHGILATVVDAIERHVPDHALARKDALREPDVEGGPSRKRRRVDQDYKDELTRRVLEKRRGHAKSALYVAHDYSESMSRKEDAKAMTAYQEACWREFGRIEAGVWCTAEDAARLGKPAKEMVLTTVQNNEIGLAAVLPPQDTTG